MTEQDWPTAEQFDAAHAAGTSYALAEYQNGATASQESPLSGEWADNPTPRTVAAQVGWNAAEVDTEGSAMMELADAWERGYFDAWAHVDEDQG